MSARLWETELILKDHGADVDLTKKWIVIEYEDAYPINAVITLNAKGGRFITTGTIIAKWDRLFLKITDQNGTVITTVVHVEKLEVLRPKGKGLQLKLYCPHQSSNLMKQTVSKPNRRTSGAVAMNDIVDQINANRANKDPSIEKVSPFDVTNKWGNRLSTLTSNDYIFESVKADRAIQEIIDREGQPTEGGGSFEFHMFRFVSKYDGTTEADLDVVYLSVFEQGFMTSNGTDFTNIAQVTLTKPTLASGDRANTLQIDSPQETEKGTNLVGIGDLNSGTYPVDFSIFQGEREFFNSARQWESGVNYDRGNLVEFGSDLDGVAETYECIQANLSDGTNSPPNLSFWLGRNFDLSAYFEWQTGLTITKNEVYRHNKIGYRAEVDHTSNTSNEPPNPDFWQRVSYAPTVDYSPLTVGRAQYWVNAMGGAKYAATDNGRSAVLSPDLLVQDDQHPRTWVDTIQYDPSLIPSTLLKSGLPYDTLRVLVIDQSDGTDRGEGGFSGTDSNGVTFAGNIAEWNGSQTTGEWLVVGLGGRDPVLVDDQEVYDFDEGLSWVKNPRNNLGGRFTTWQKGAYYRLTDNVPVIGDNATWIADAQFECAHPPRWDGTNNRIDMGNTQILGDDVDTGGNSAVFIKFNPQDLTKGLLIRSRFMGLNFAFPFPRTSNSVPFNPVTVGEQINLEQFDFVNMHLTSKGGREWFGPNVEDYYPIQGFGLYELIRDLQPLIGPKLFAGDYSMGIWLADRRDNMWVIDYSHAHNDVTESSFASFGLRKVYRARPGHSTIVPAQQPEITDIVDPRSIVRGGLYTKDSYDKSGRFDNDNTFRDSTTLEYSIDAFRMTKPLVCTNVEEPNAKPERNIEPQKLLYEKIVSYAQLKNLMLANEQILGFRIDRYNLETPGRLNIKWGDPVYYNDPEAVPQTTDSLTNTIKGVAQKIVYSLSKTPDGPGGFTRSVYLATRIWPQ